MELKQKQHEIEPYPRFGICPWCSGKVSTEHTDDSYNGRFAKCPNCHATFAVVSPGATFTIGEPFKACTVYRVEDVHPVTGMVSCVEIAKVSSSKLDKPNGNCVVYFNQAHIVSAMVGHYREGLV